MENVFTVTLGPTFGLVRKYKYRLYGKLPRPIGLELERRATNRLYDRLTRLERDHERRESLEHEWMFEMEQVQDAYAEYVSGKLLEQARRYFLERPKITGRDDDPNWERSHTTGDYRLTPRAAAKLRVRIRREQQAIRDSWHFRAGIIFGALGTLAGIASAIAVFLKG